MLPSLLSLHPDLARARRDARHPAGAQARLLRFLLRKASATEFGRSHHFVTLLREPDVVQAFQEAVPLYTSAMLADELARVRRGEKDVLWPGRIRHFAISSGTASAGTVLPRTLQHLKRDARFSVEVGLNYLAHTGRMALLGGKHLSVPGRVEPDAVQHGAQIGEVSGLVASAAPAFFRRLYQAVPNEVAFRDAWEARLDAIAALVVNADIRLIAMVPSWSATLFARVRDRYRALHGHTPETMSEIWPNLQLFVSGGVALSSYRDSLQAEIGLDTVDYVEAYGASEGFFAFMDHPADSSLRLHLSNGVFYEFVPEDRLGDPYPPRLTVADVQPGARYAIYVSTMSGLWAYAVGDFVRFTQSHPPRIVVAGRTREVLDRYGEAVYGDEAAAAFTLACHATSAHGAEFHVTTDADGGTPHLRWVVAFHQMPGDVQRWGQVVEQHLQAVNRHYQIRRATGALGAVEVVVVAPEAFLLWLQASRARVGAQTKVPRMSEEPEVAARIIGYSPDVKAYTISL